MTMMKILALTFVTALSSLPANGQTDAPTALVDSLNGDNETSSGACAATDDAAEECLLQTLSAQDGLACASCITGDLFDAAGILGAVVRGGCTGVSQLVCDSFATCPECDPCLVQLVEQTSCEFAQTGILPDGCALDCSLTFPPTVTGGPTPAPAPSNLPPTSSDCELEFAALDTCIQALPEDTVTKCGVCVNETATSVIAEGIGGDSCTELFASMCQVLKDCGCTECFQEVQQTFLCGVAFLANEFGVDLSCGWGDCKVDDMMPGEPTMTNGGDEPTAGAGDEPTAGGSDPAPAPTPGDSSGWRVSPFAGRARLAMFLLAAATLF